MNFDLNISNYKPEELVDIFNLPPKYELSSLNYNDLQLRENVKLNQTIDTKLKEKTLNFLTQAKIILAKNATEPYILTKNPDDNKYAINDDLTLKSSPLVKGTNETFEIQRQPYGYSNSFSSAFGSNYYSGTINPLVKKINKININIDTRFRDNYYNTTASDFNLELPNKYLKVVSMQLNAIELPTSFYVISKQNGNNFLNIKIDDVSGTIIDNLTIIVPDGNYTPSSLVGVFNNYCSGSTSPYFDSPMFKYYKQLYFTLNIDSTNSGSAQIIVGVNWTNADNVDEQINTFTLNFQGDSNGLPDISTQLPLKLGWLLGFRNGIYENNNSYVSEGIVDLIGPRYLYLVVDDYNNNVYSNYQGAFQDSMLDKNILARITLQQGTFNIFAQNNVASVTIPRYYYGPVDVQKLRIQLLDEYGRVLCLNNMDYSMCISLECAYDI